MSHPNPNRWIPLTFFLWLRAFRVVFALQTNFTVEDSDPSILYTPPEAWDLHTDDFPSFLNTSLRIAHSGSYSAGVELIRALGVASFPSRSTRDVDPGHPSRLPLHDKTSHQTTPRSKRHDPPPQPATLEFNFTGSAVYLFGPYALPPSSTVTIDGQLYQTTTTDQANFPVFAQRNLPESPHSLIVTLGPDSVFLFDYLIYTHDLSTGLHLAAADLVPSSSSPHPTVPLPEAFSLPSITSHEPAAATTSTSPSKGKNVATFAAAVGGSVGVLALFSAGLALSIIRRRYRAAKRERLDRSENGGGAGLQHQHQQMEEGGSDTFVPRFFPGTEFPPNPPTYSDSIMDPPPPHELRGLAASGTLSPDPNSTETANTNGNEHARRGHFRASILPDYPYLVSVQQHHPYIHRHQRRLSNTTEDMSYADIPPETPPPLPEMVLRGEQEAPPSFPEAIASAPLPPPPSLPPPLILSSSPLPPPPSRPLSLTEGMEVLGPSLGSEDLEDAVDESILRVEGHAAGVNANEPEVDPPLLRPALTPSPPPISQQVEQGGHGT